jgi:hypothetical protein
MWQRLCLTLFRMELENPFTDAVSMNRRQHFLPVEWSVSFITASIRERIAVGEGMGEILIR